jgi:hypothetical protein
MDLHDGRLPSEVNCLRSMVQAADGRSIALPGKGFKQM